MANLCCWNLRFIFNKNDIFLFLKLSILLVIIAWIEQSVSYSFYFSHLAFVDVFIISYSLNALVYNSVLGCYVVFVVCVCVFFLSIIIVDLHFIYNIKIIVKWKEKIDKILNRMRQFDFVSCPYVKSHSMHTHTPHTKFRIMTPDSNIFPSFPTA